MTNLSLDSFWGQDVDRMSIDPSDLVGPELACVLFVASTNGAKA